jgi:CBS domain-containing protein
MTQDVTCIAADATLRAAASQMRDLDVGPLPVCHEDRLVGMLTDRDIVVRCIADGVNPDETRVREAMTPDVYYCFDDQNVIEAADMMRDHQIRRLLVLNRDKRMVGIVSLGDLAVESGDRRLSGSTLEAISQPVHS